MENASGSMATFAGAGPEPGQEIQQIIDSSQFEQSISADAESALRHRTQLAAELAADRAPPTYVACDGTPDD
jgi:hypothetical protein